MNWKTIGFGGIFPVGYGRKIGVEDVSQISGLSVKKEE